MGRFMQISEIISKRYVGKEVSIRGWIHRKRSSGGMQFVIIRDSTGIIQVAIKKQNVSQKAWENSDKALIESSVAIKGVVKKDERAPNGYELLANDIGIISFSESFPITEYQSAELLLDKRHLWLRSQRMTAIMKARAYIFRYTRQFLDKNDFYEITPPLITKAGGETGANLFETNYFGQKAYLTESSQLYAEAMVPALERVYSFVPAFRAERSRTTKHLAELWMVEPEMAYFDQKMNMELQEKLVSYVANNFAKNHEDLLETMKVNKESLLKVKPPFKRISYEKALEILNEKGVKKKWGDDFGVEDEKLLTEDEEKPIFVHSFAKELKAFYASLNPKDPRTAASADMLGPKGHGELLGGTEREWRLKELLERMRETEKTKGIKFNMENYAWWIDLRRYGSIPHAGFGMGMERVIKWILNLDHIRDAIPFPRTINRVYP